MIGWFVDMDMHHAIFQGEASSYGTVPGLVFTATEDCYFATRTILLFITDPFGGQLAPPRAPQHRLPRILTIITCPGCFPPLPSETPGRYEHTRHPTRHPEPRPGQGSWTTNDDDEAK
ncbi:hypothetical protein VTN02DRAFT_6574 [Thermoascus thermophilus]